MHNKRLEHHALCALDSQQVARCLGGRYETAVKSMRVLKSG